MKSAAVIMVLLLAPPDPPPPPAPPIAAPASDRGLLAGPKVQPQEDTDEPGMAFGGDDRRGRYGDRAEARRWLAALRAIELGDEQRREILGIVSELRRARRAFADARGDPEAAPNVDAYRQRIWELLDPAQQEALRRATAAMSARAAEPAPPGAGPGKAQRRIEFLKAHQKDTG